MVIHILCFGQVAETTGQSGFEVSAVEDTNSLKSLLLQDYPSLENIPFAFAVNKKLVHVNTLLNSGDTVALLPPFSGG